MNVSSVMSADGSSSRTRIIPSGPGWSITTDGVSPKSVPRMSGQPRRNWRFSRTCRARLHEV